MSPEPHRLAVAIALLLCSCSRPPSVESLLQQAYRDERRFPWQLPSSAWSEVNTNSKSPLDRSPALIQAEAALADAPQPELEGRAYLIEARAELALNRLAGAASPTTPPGVASPGAVAGVTAASPGAIAGILVDLAVAHALSADRGGPAAGYAAAIEYTTRALAADAKNKRAHFNRALALERLGLLQRARSEWTAYLALESDANWRREATQRRQALQARLEVNGLPVPLSGDPDAKLIEDIVRTKGSLDAAASRASADTAWLNDARREEQAGADGTFLLRLLRLSEASEASQALLLAPQIQRAYAAAPAHALRAEFELVFARNRRMDAPTCVAEAARLSRKARQRNYLWLALQSEVVGAGCLYASSPPAQAIARLRQSEAEAQTLGLPGVLARARAFRASMQIATGDPWTIWDDGRQLLQQLNAQHQPYKRQHLTVLNYHAAAAQRGWHAAAYEFGLTAAAMAAEIPHRVTEASNRQAAASSALSAGLFVEASREAKVAQEMYAQMRESPERTRYLASLNVLQAKSLLGAGQPKQAIAILESSQANLKNEDDKRNASETLGLAYLALAQPAGARTQLEACLHSLRKTEARERRRLVAQHRNAYRALARILLDAGQPQQALQIWLEAHGSSTPPGVVYLALPNGYAVWTKAGHLRLTLNRAELRTQAQALARAAATPDSSLAQLRGHAKALFAAVVAPLTEAIWQQPTLSILPDGELAEIPLALLVTPDGQWWGPQHNLIQAAHPTSLDFPAPRRALAVAVAAGPAHLPPLPDAAAEANQIATHFPVTALINAQASAEAFRRHFPEADLFHFSGHGWSSPDLGGVYLAGSILTPLTLPSSSLPHLHLVVLSACFTAAGTNTGLANPDSLVTALLDIGAGTVLASRWAIDSAATRRWMSTFYARLAAHDSPAVAARQAQQVTERHYAHPYYWAAFQLYR